MAVLTKNETNKKWLRHWSKHSQNYDECVEYIFGREICEAIFDKLSCESALGEVVELGCGTGIFTKIAARNAKHVTATDFSDEMLAVAQVKLKDLPNVVIKKADCVNTLFPSQSFDTVLAVNVLPITDIIKVLKESHRILKDNGTLLIANYTFHGMAWIEIIKWITKSLRKFGMPPLYGLKDFYPKEIVALVKKGGFKIEDFQVMGRKVKAYYLKARKNTINL